MIEIELRKRLGQVLINASFSIESPGITAIFGRSGAGKTSVINMIAGLTKPDEGFVRLNGQTLFDAERRINEPTHSRRMGYVFQDGRLFPHLTVKQNLLYGARGSASGTIAAGGAAAGASGTGAAGHTPISLDEVAELLGITHLLERRPAQLSGGEKQRIAIGRALLAKPQLLLMDEPLASLDMPRKNELMPYIAELPHRFGIPVVYVTHSIHEIMRLADQLVYMRDGASLDCGATEKVLNSPKLQDYLTTEDKGTVLRAEVVESDGLSSHCRIESTNTVLNVSRGSLKVGTTVRFRIAAEDIILSLELPQKMSVQNAIPAQIHGMRLTEHGLVEVELDIGVDLTAIISQEAWKELNLDAGRTVYVLIKSAAITRNSVIVGSSGTTYRN